MNKRSDLTHQRRDLFQTTLMRWIAVFILTIISTPPIQAAPFADLPYNQWIKISSTNDFVRQQHAGIAYDSRRGTVLIFGSDTHGRNWDNTVREFDPDTGVWTQHQTESALDDYRLTETGLPEAGDSNAPQPWAMHTYDCIVYDEIRDGLVVSAVPAHNRPAKKRAGKPTDDPPWFYDLKTRSWSRLSSAGDYQAGFAASCEYDHLRDTVVVFRFGIRELSADRKAWIRSAPGKQHGIHHSLVQDTDTGALYVFGGNKKPAGVVWAYWPGNQAGAAGQWREMPTSGDEPPSDQHFPVAYSPRERAFLLVVDVPAEKRAETYTYRPSANSTNFTRIEGADLDRQRMNYMMVYDSKRDVFLLITGRPGTATEVWALKLKPSLQ